MPGRSRYPDHSRARRWLAGMLLLLSLGSMVALSLWSGRISSRVPYAITLPPTIADMRMPRYTSGEFSILLDSVSGIGRGAHLLPTAGATGLHTATVRYTISPSSDFVADAVTLKVTRAATGTPVYLRTYTDAAYTTGGRHVLTWNGEDNQTDAAFADPEFSPYQVQLLVSSGSLTMRSNERKLIVDPEITGVLIVSHTKNTVYPPTGDNKFLHGDPQLFAVILATDPADPAKKRKRMYLGDDEMPDSLICPDPNNPQHRAKPFYIGDGTLFRWKAWPAARQAWSDINFKWYVINPREGHPRTIPGNDPQDSAYRWYTNVKTEDANKYLTSQGVYSRTPEGDNLDIIQYINSGQHFFNRWRNAPGYFSIVERNGTHYYRVAAWYGDDTLQQAIDEQYGGGAPYRWSTPGRPDSSRLSGLEPSAYFQGITPTVHRISRITSARSPNNCGRISHPATDALSASASGDLLAYAEAMKGVPWIYGSTTDQRDRLVGFDCADLICAAAYQCGLKRTPVPVEWSSATQVATNDHVSRPRSLHYTLDTSVHLLLADKQHIHEVAGIQNGHAVPGPIIRIALNAPKKGTAGTVYTGDLVMIRYLSLGLTQYDHSALIYQQVPGELTPYTRVLLMGHHGATSSRDLTSALHGADGVFVLRYLTQEE